MDEVAVVVHRLVRCGMAAAAGRLVQFQGTAAFGTQLQGQDAVPVLHAAHDRGTGTVAEEDAGVAVRPVRDAGQGFGPDDEDLLVQAAGNHLRCHAEAVHEARAARRQVEGAGMGRAELVLDDAGRGRINVIRRGRGHDDQIQFLRLDAGVLEGRFGGFQAHVRRGRFRVGDAPFPNTCPFDDPVIRCIDELL